MSDDTVGRIVSARVPEVRGMVIGRGRLHPPGGDVASAVDRTAGLL